MSNNIITSRVAVPFVAEMESRLHILMNGNTQFDKNFVGGHGTTIDVIIPGYGAINVGPDMSSFDLSYTSAKQSVTLVQRDTGVSLTQVEQSLYLSSYDDQIAAPYGAKFASDIQQVASQELLLKADTATVLNTGTGAYGDISKGISAIRAARSSGLIFGVLQNDLATQVQNSGLSFLNPSASISKSFLEGGIGKFRGAEWYETPDVAGLQAGDHTPSTSANLRGTISADGGTLNLSMSSGTLTGTYKQGEIITLAGVKAVTIYGVALSQDYAFVVQADTLCASDKAAIPIKPVYISGPLKNISLSALPSSALVATEQTTANNYYLRGIVWDKQAFVYASAKLPPLAMTKKTGEFKHADGQALSVLAQIGTDVIKGIDIVRYDVLTGFLLARSNWVSTILVKV